MAPANAELSQRAARAIQFWPPDQPIEMRWAFSDAFLTAETFEDLPREAQVLLEALEEKVEEAAGFD